jgi:hypothetical protein
MKLLELPTFVWQHATLYVGCANKCFVLPNSEFEFSTCAQLKFGKTQLCMWGVQTNVSFCQILSLSFPLVHNLSLAKRNFVCGVCKQMFRFAKF